MRSTSRPKPFHVGVPPTRAARATATHDSTNELQSKRVSERVSGSVTDPSPRRTYASRRCASYGVPTASVAMRAVARPSGIGPVRELRGAERGGPAVEAGEVGIEVGRGAEARVRDRRRGGRSGRGWPGRPRDTRRRRSWPGGSVGYSSSPPLVRATSRAAGNAAEELCYRTRRLRGDGRHGDRRPFGPRSAEFTMEGYDSSEALNGRGEWRISRHAGEVQIPRLAALARDDTGARGARSG